MAIVKYEWDLGNGVISSSPSPYTTYTPGYYNVQLIATTDTGETFVVQKINFIVVSEDQQNLFHSRYITNPKSFHYGDKESTSTGWSRNSGDNWIWPESQAAVSHEVINGIDHLLVWDMYDDKQYVINPRNSAVSDITHLDKDVHEIDCSATFRGITGISRTYDIMHQETVIQLRKDIDTKTRPSGMRTFISLIGEDGEVLEKVEAVTGREIVFKEQSEYINGEHGLIQLKFETDKSGYQLVSYESTYKTNDKSDSAQQDVLQNTEVLVANVSTWVTRALDYEVDLATGTALTVSGTRVTGPDSLALTAITLSADLDLQNVSVIESTFFFWYKGTVQPDVGFAVTDVTTKNGFTLAYVAGTIQANIIMPSGATIFDARVVTGQLSEETLADYADNLELHLGAY